MDNFRKPLVILGSLFAAVLLCFLGIQLHKYRARQARLCTRSTLCRHGDISSVQKPPPVGSEVLRPLVSQPLFFLGEGKQCVAYETADGKYVVKLFKKSTKKKKQKQLQEYISGGIIARTIIPEETGVLAVVCGQEGVSPPVVTVLNKRGRIEKLALKDFPFILQRKAQPFKQTLLRLVSEKRMKEAALRIESLFTLLSLCRDRGVLDRDGSLIRNGNLGFVDGKVVLLDTGKLCQIKDRKRQTLHDLNRLKPLQTWLEEACPELVPTFMDCQARYRNSINKK